MRSVFKHLRSNPKYTRTALAATVAGAASLDPSGDTPGAAQPSGNDVAAEGKEMDFESTPGAAQPSENDVAAEGKEMDFESLLEDAYLSMLLGDTPH